jgi:Protein of unknown function (DUF559)
MERTSAERPKDPARLAALLDRQHLVVSLWQLADCGYSEWAVRRAVAAREFRRLHRGVFTTGGPRLTFSARCMAAVLACGLDAVLSHHAAAALHDLRPVPQGAIDVTAPGKRRHRGVRSHVSSIARHQRTEIDGIAVTCLERTYLDYAERATSRQLLAALEAGERRNVLDIRRLRMVIDDSPGRRGLKPLSHAMAQLTDDPAWTQSPAEDLFLELIAAAGLPLPRANVLIEGVVVDFVWPQQRLIVEIDGFAFHRTHAAFENDRRRDRELQKRGWRVIRVTYRQLQEEPHTVIKDVAHMLSQ